MINIKSYIVFNGYSSNEILDGNLILCSFDYNDTVISVKRTLQKGSITKSRNIGNDLGVIYDEPLSFNFALVKEDHTEFTYSETRKINKWLSPEYNKQLVLYSDDYDSEFYYNGNFEKVEMKRINGVNGFICSFINNSAFMFRGVTVSKTLFADGETSDSIIINYDGDLDIVYPTIRLKDGNSGAEVTYDITIRNNAFTIDLDGIENSFDINLRNKLEINGESCIVLSNDDAIPLSNVFVDNHVDWLKLKTGENNIVFYINSPSSFPENFSITVEISYKEKILGGVINEFN